MKVVLVEGGEESCTVGFLPRYIAMHPEQVCRLHGQFAQIIELYDELDTATSYNRIKSARNNGMASYVLLNAEGLL